MESANAGMVKTLGLVENHPVRLGPITVYLQIQVIENAPFEVLLGRPFFDVLSCSEVSQAGGSHEIHVTDPKTGTPYVFPTEPRFRRRHQPKQESLGTRAQIPTGYMVKTLRSQSTFDSNMPSDQMLSTF